MFHVNHTDMDVIVMPIEQLKTLMIESFSVALKYHQPAAPVNHDTAPYGDFKWLQSTCPSVPASTLRIKSASGEIPGVIKVGKRVLYEKSVVLNWLRSQTRKPVSSTLIERQAEEQFSQQLSKRGGVIA